MIDSQQFKKLNFKRLLELSAQFESYLGNPEHCSSVINFDDILDYDERELLNWDHIRYIQSWGLMDYLIPESKQGMFHSLDALHLLFKSIARRDITISITLGVSFLAALPIWISGSHSLQEYLAEQFRARRLGALALTEKDHGSHIMANDMHAQKLSQHWVLNGEKWCINFATASDFIVILSRSHPDGGPLGFSLFLLDKILQINGLEQTPKLPSLGVRGLDLSGFTLKNTRLPLNALIGTEGHGLQIVYKTLQLSRILCAPLATGAADTALRFAVQFCLKRNLYQKPVYYIPVVKQKLGEQFTLLLIADCIALAVVRAATIFPKTLSLWSALIKFLVPDLAEQVVEQSSTLIGARAYLRTASYPIMQKIRRDIKLIGLFDGSSQVNLSIIASHLPAQAYYRKHAKKATYSKIKKIFDLNECSNILDFSSLALTVSTEDEILASLFCLPAGPLDSMILMIKNALYELDHEVHILKAQKTFDTQGLTEFELAERYSWLFAASCCVHFWYFNQTILLNETITLAWVTLALQIILNRVQNNVKKEKYLQELMADTVVDFYKQKKMFSMVSACLG